MAKFNLDPGGLRGAFTPSKEPIWTQIAEEIGGSYLKGGFWGKDILRFRHGDWEILLDTFTRTSSSSNRGTRVRHYTRMRAPFVNKDGLRFTICRKGLFSSVGKLFGMQDLEIGDPFFDDPFIIKGNDQEKIARLLSGATLKEFISEQPDIYFKVADDDGFFRGSFPDGVDQLYFECTGVVTDANVLKSLFELFSLTLIRLVQIDPASEDDPNVNLKWSRPVVRTQRTARVVASLAASAPVRVSRAGRGGGAPRSTGAPPRGRGGPRFATAVDAALEGR